MPTLSKFQRSRPHASLITRLFPQRELLLKRSWIIGGYGRALPKRSGRIDPAPAAPRPLPRPYQLRHDQIIDPAPVLELRENQIISPGMRLNIRNKAYHPDAAMRA